MGLFTNVVVSNRLPVKISRDDDGKLSYSQSDGGLATALSSIGLENMVWIGWPGIASDELSANDKKEITKELKKRGCLPVFLTAEEIELFYEGYANDTLWPLFHYFPSYMVNHDRYWNAYKKVNEHYRDAVCEVAKADASILVQDYQLMLLPRMVRDQLPDSLIGYFHHVPFPSYEIYRLLPQRRELIEGLLGADLIGFHIYDYARHFLSSCLRTLGMSHEYGTLHVDERIVKVDSFPIGIDYNRFEAMRADKELQARATELREAYDGQHIILSAGDRLDYSKGLPERLNAYHRFLEDNPEYLGQVVLIFQVSPSRMGVETYQRLHERLEQMVSRINGEFGTAEWQPIVYQFQNLSPEELVSLFMAADVSLVTPLRDGMNLVAKEYIAAQADHPGMLILSEMAGAADELPEAILVNPNNTLAISKAITRALTMSENNRQTRVNAMQRRIRDYPIQRWGEDYMKALNAVRALQREVSVVSLTASRLKEMCQAYEAAKKRVFLLDYDGTLRDFEATPDIESAAPDAELHALIRSLASNPLNIVCIISGRSKDALEAWFGDTDAQLIAEHGAWVRRDDGWHKRDFDFEPVRQAIEPVLLDYTSRTPGSRIEQKDFASVWHYRNVPVYLARVRAFSILSELNAAIADDSIGVYNGQKIIEIKPRSVSKRSAVEVVLNSTDPDFVLVIGDDYTDEDMFDAAGNNAYTVKVGPGDTNAQYRLANVAAVHRTLKKLASASECNE